jgi:carboxypeptidase Taq
MSQKMINFKKKLEKIRFLSQMSSRIFFDKETSCPRLGLACSEKEINYLNEQIYHLKHQKSYVEALTYLYENKAQEDVLDQKLLDNLFEEYQKEKMVSKEQFNQIASNLDQVNHDFLLALDNDDPTCYLLSLKKQITYLKEVYHDKKETTYYDFFLNQEEKGLTSTKLDQFFTYLNDQIQPLLNQINQANVNIRDDFLAYPINKYEQEKIGHQILKIIKLDEQELFLGTSLHPFSMVISPGDVRITTEYEENNFFANFYSILHEGGHGLVSLNIPQNIREHYLEDYISTTKHECIARFYENFIGRSRAFIHLMYPYLHQIPAYQDISEEEFYLALNQVKCSLIRMDADEITYNEHIFIRYLLEKDFINNDDYPFEELTARWNHLYQKYLHIEVPSKKKGILQDGHWTSSYGYFPTYALANAYGAQLYYYMNKDFDVAHAISHGDFDQILQWLKTHAFNSICSSTLEEWIFEATHEKFNPQYYISYLKEKYQEIYHLDD